MNGFERRREKIKDKILQAAFELFAAQGVKAVGIAEIAQRADVSQVSIYNFFGNKENLARQAVFTFMNIKAGEFKALVDSPIPFREKFEQMITVRMDTTQQYSEDFFQAEAYQDPSLQQFLAEYYQTRILPIFRDLIAQGKQEGSIAAELSDEAILMYIGMFNSSITRTDLPKKVQFDLGALFFYGLLGKPWQSGSIENR